MTPGHHGFMHRMMRIFSFVLLFIPLQFTAPTPSEAEWSATAENTLFYTDEAALFSSTRRLTRNQDPTQPVIDRPLAEQGSDVVYEPTGTVTQSFGSPGQQTEISMAGQGFLFADNSRFNHGTFGVQIRQELSPTTTWDFAISMGPIFF